VRRYFPASKFIIVGTALLAVACSSTIRDTALPTWAISGDFSEVAAPVPLQGKWVLNETLSDDPQPLIRRAVEALKKDRRSVLGDPAKRGPGGRPVIKADEVFRVEDEADPYGEAAMSDPRLAALRAKSIRIEQNASTVSFIFDDQAVVDHPVNQATSADENINLSFADWEGSQFVVEKNGPDGLMLERWILSPDYSQLYLAVSLEIKMPDFPVLSEPVLIGRMFDRDPR
jgi:hypothetical protein